MAVDLPRIVRETRRSRRPITLRPIFPTQAQANTLARLYMRVVRLWDASRAPLLAQYTATLSGMTRDSAEDMAVTIAQTEAGMLRVLVQLFPELQEWAKTMEAWHRANFQGAVLAATGVQLDTILIPSDVSSTVSATIERNVALIKDVSAQTQGRISDIVYRGTTNRTPARQVAKEMQEAVQLGRKRSLRIASDQASKLAGSLDRARQEDAGITEFVWRHSGKLHPRPEHVARNGKVYKWSNPPPDLPGQLPNCGCRAQAHISFDDE